VLVGIRDEKLNDATLFKRYLHRVLPTWVNNACFALIRKFTTKAYKCLCLATIEIDMHCKVLENTNNDLDNIGKMNFQRGWTRGANYDGLVINKGNVNNGRHF